MNSERQIVQRLIESIVTVNGHKYECYFGKYYKDGERITRDQYLEETGQSTTNNGAVYEPSEDGEHQVVTKNGETHHLDYGESLDDEEEENDEVPQDPQPEPPPPKTSYKEDFIAKFDDLETKPNGTRLNFYSGKCNYVVVKHGPEKFDIIKGKGSKRDTVVAKKLRDLDKDVNNSYYTPAMVKDFLAVVGDQLYKSSHK